MAKQPKKVMLSKALFEELKSQGFDVGKSEIVSQNARTVSLELDDAKYSRLWELTDDITNGDNTKLKNVSSAAASRSAEAWQNKNKGDRPASVVNQQRANAEAAVARSKAAREVAPEPAAKKVLKSAADPAAPADPLSNSIPKKERNLGRLGDNVSKNPAPARTPKTTPEPAAKKVLKSAADPATPVEVVQPTTKPARAPKSGKPPKAAAERVLKSAVDPAATPTSAAPTPAAPKSGKPPKTPKGTKAPSPASQEISDAIDAEIEFQRRTAGRTGGLGKSGITEDIGEYRDLIDEMEQTQKVIGSDADIEAGNAKVVSTSPTETVSDRVDESYSRLDQIKAEQKAKRAAARGLSNVDQAAQAEAESLRAVRAQLGLTPSPVVDEVTVEAAQQFSDRRRALDAKVAQGMLSADDAAALLQKEFDALDPAAKQVALRTAQKAQQLAEQGAQNAVAARASEAADVVLAANMKADPRYVSPVSMSSDHLRDVSDMSNQSYSSLRKQLTGLGMSPDDISGLSPAARSGMSLSARLAPPALGATGYPTPFGAPHTMPAPGAPVIASQATQNAARAAAQATGGAGGFGPPTGTPTPGGVPGGGGGMGKPPTGPAVPGLPVPGGGVPGVPTPSGPFDGLLFKAPGGMKGMAKTAFGRLGPATGWLTAGQLAGGASKALWDDPESQADDALSSALTWGGSGAALGSMILPGWGTAIGGGLGLIAGGVKGWMDGDGASKEDILNAANEQRAKLDDAFDRLGVSAQARQDLYDRIEVQVALGAKSAADVEAIYAQAAQMAPDVIQQSRRQAKLAALQAAILPMMQENRDWTMQRNQAAQGWLNQAASTSSDPTVAALLRAQGETLMGNAANYANASYGQAIAMPTLMDLYGTAGPYPTDSSTGLVDYQNLMAQLQPAG